jgi:hypothetical protein
MLERLIFSLLILLTLPFVLLAIPIGVAELMLSTKGDLTLWVVKPFTWAYERKRYELF